MRISVVTIGVAISLACIASFPMDWAVSKFIPIQYTGKNTHISGNVWNGRIENFVVPWGQIDNVQVNTSPHRLLTQTPVEISTTGLVFLLGGLIGYNRAEFVDVYANLAQVPLTDSRLVGVFGRATIIDFGLAAKKGKCQSAKGNVWTDVLAVNKHMWNWHGPVLSGPISCENKKLKFILSGQEKGIDIHAILYIDFDGRYIVDVSVQTTDTQAAAFLPLLGFSQTNSGYNLKEQGLLVRG